MSGAFVTGSHAYGKPGPDSDVDLVVMARDYKDIRAVIDAFCVDEDNGVIRAGNLNLIVCGDDVDWAIWRLGTYALQRRRTATKQPVTRAEAAELFNKLRANVGRPVFTESNTGQETPPKPQQRPPVASRTKPQPGQLPRYVDDDIPF